MKSFFKRIQPLFAAVILLVLAAAVFGRGESGQGLWDIARIALVFALVVALLRQKAGVGAALLLAALTLGTLFAVPYQRLFQTMTLGLLGERELLVFLRRAVVLCLVITFINVLGLILSESGGMRRLIASLGRLTRDVRFVAAMIPSAIGLLPMPGGAMITAPFVEELGHELGLDPEAKTAINYWFRHTWEFWWPMFPAVLLLLTPGYLPTDFSLWDLMKPGLILSLTALVAGWFFLLRPVAALRAQGESQHPLRDLLSVLATLWPLLVAVFVVLLVHPPQQIRAAMLPWPVVGHVMRAINRLESYRDLAFPATLLLLDCALIAQHRLSRAQVVKIVRRAASPSMIAMIFTVYMLQAMFDVSGAATHLPTILKAYHIPTPLVLFLVPWTVGMLTGYTFAGVSTTFPLLHPLFLSAPHVALAYTGAFLGVMMSPVHLCLILTTQYFGANMAIVYARLARMYAVVLVVLAALAWMTWG